ncbi:MAG: alpha/beta fold hydrolase [Candidatus Tectimicrobiota bacterium]
MATTSTPWTEDIVEAAGIKLQMVKGGTGRPLLILHDELGHPGVLRYHTALAQHYTLYMPSHPGCGQSERLDWLMNMRDLAGWYLDALDDLGLTQVPVLGLSLGGWLAAEMASMCPQQFSHLILAGAMGVRPTVGEIYDMFLVVTREYIAASFANAAQTPEYQQLFGEAPTPDQTEVTEAGRELASLVGWRPYMHYPQLVHLLRRVRRVPTLLVWGRQDAIVPLSAGEAYQRAIPGSRLAVLEQCGHRPEIEQADAFVRLVRDFVGE